MLVKPLGSKRIIIKVNVILHLRFLSMTGNHSQGLNEKPLTPWIISMADGKILAAHCDCVAGVGEACSHVASLLWVLAVRVEQRESLLSKGSSQASPWKGSTPLTSL